MLDACSTDLLLPAVCVYTTCGTRVWFGCEQPAVALSPHLLCMQLLFHSRHGVKLNAGQQSLLVSKQ
jgi:hypothetical protein